MSGHDVAKAAGRARTRTLWPVLGCAALLMLAMGCRVNAGGPRDAVTRYSDALRRNDYVTAYEMMSASFRDAHSREEFVRMMKDNPQEVRETAARLKGTTGSMKETAQMRYGLGDELLLVREGNGWRIASNPIQFYSQATPRDALRSFVRAYKLKRYDVMLRLVPDRYRARMDEDKLRRQLEGESREDTETVMQLLEANLDEPITDKGAEARMQYGERYEVKLIREDGVWKIQDID